MSAPPLFGPGWGNYAIRGIIEVTFPEPVPLYPQTPGWWLLLIGGLVLMGWLLRRRRQRWLRNRYRRQALQALGDIKARIMAGDSSAARELAPLLRATALNAGDRPALASLSGSAWADAVNAMTPDLTPLPVAELERLAYEPLHSASRDQGASYIEPLARWIESHRDRHGASGA